MKRTIIAAAAMLAVTGADAAILSATYVQITNGGPAGIQANVGSLGTATWTYDTATGDLASTGVTQHVFESSGVNVFTHNFTNLAITGAGVATATSYTCTPGPIFAGALGKNLCAGVKFNTDAVAGSQWPGLPNTNDSTYDVTGTLTTFAGDDACIAGPTSSPCLTAQTLAQVFSLNDRIVVGGTVKARKLAYDPTQGGNYEMTFTVVPVPGAVWLLGSALGLVGLLRRKLV